MRRRASAALIFAAMLNLARGEARADERAILRWNAPAECPEGARVIEEMNRILGPTAARPPKPIEAVASVLRDDQGVWRVHLETEGEGATRVRELKGATCAAIADATALILALMIDPTAVASAPVSKPETAPAAPTAPAPTAPPTPAPAAPIA